MKRKLLRDFYPDLADQLVDKSLGDSLASRSREKVRWRCEFGHEWEASVFSRVSCGSGCPYCSGRRRIVGVNDLATTHPDIAAQLVDRSLGQELAPKSARRVMWRCEFGHEWEASVLSRTSGNGCPVCSNRLVVAGVNDLWTTHPELAGELVDPELGYQVTYGSMRRLRWRCSLGHEWDAVVSNRSRQGQGCPYCSNHSVLVGFNDLATTHPELCKSLVNADVAKEVVAGSQRLVSWQCFDCGCVWDARVYSRAIMGAGCPACSHSFGRRKIGGFADFVSDDSVLLTAYPRLASELQDRSLASELFVGSPRIVGWRCVLGHEWEARVADRVKGNDCPYCTNRKVLVGFNDLATTHPELVSLLADESDASDVTSGSHRKLHWRCENGHEYVAMVKDVVRGRRCPVCVGKKVVIGVNDLATTHSDLASELVDEELSYQVVSGSNKLVEWECARGHRWSSSVRARALQGQGCPYCSGRRVLAGETDLGSVYPEIAAELVDQSLASELAPKSNRIVRWRCERGHEWETAVCCRTSNGSGCPICAIGQHASKGERDLVAFVRGILPDDVEILLNDRKLIGPKELDLVIPSLHLAIEFNGCYWHSEACDKGHCYHWEKWRRCRDVGYQLVFVWEDDWNFRRDVVRKMLAAKLGVGASRRLFARKLLLGDVSGSEARRFTDANHIQGSVGSTRHFGLFDDGELVALLSVRNPSSNSRLSCVSGDWEVRRYVTSCSVVGGFSRLLAYAERCLLAEGEDVRRWFSFSANDVSDGHLYEVCGFRFDGDVAPDYKYVGNFTGHVRMSKEGFQKRRFRDDDSLLYESGLTERELAEMNGLVRCWDAGKMRWVKDVVR